ncbi:DUF6924 domain-containing protein [Streptomyces sp. NPDC058405]|uniref:DUF6924 domain-containing protein n=1 Tax=unclassified Streptomyces TaxID=2593676 RepID=UPI003649B409
MSSRLTVDDREMGAALVVRTDFSNAAAWQEVAVQLTRPWGKHRDHEAAVHLVNDPAWAGVTSDEVQSAASADAELSVVFLADETTMREACRPLLAVEIRAGEQCGDRDSEEKPAASSRPFRTEPTAIHDVHINLSIGNMDFEDFAEAAREDMHGVLRPL